MRNNPNPLMNLIGIKYGRLCVLRRHEEREGHWVCECECGAFTVSSSSNLKRGTTNSCGCLGREKTRERSLKHGAWTGNKVSPEYSSWCAMKTRCNNQNSKDYPRYGGAGIKVCEQWMDFRIFKKHMGPRPSLKHSIDRIDGKQGYYAANCRWATTTQQGNNRRTNRLVSFNGEMRSVAQWEKFLGVPTGRIQQRLNKGVSVHEAFTAPSERPWFKSKKPISAPMGKES